MMGSKDVERVMMVQFHQSYSYEDCIMGFSLRAQLADPLVSVRSSAAAGSIAALG